jgi:N-acetylglutamate synthase-like GNAT family acetyltransferase
MNTTMGEFSITTDKSKMDIPVIHGFITTSYWAEGIPLETVARAVEGSLCFGVFEGNKQIGVARVITDKATFAYLCDVFIDENYRGRGLGKFLLETILKHESLQGLRRFTLTTKDAHGLYSQYGFAPLSNVDRWMMIQDSEIYKKRK